MAGILTVSSTQPMQAAASTATSADWCGEQQGCAVFTSLCPTDMQQATSKALQQACACVRACVRVHPAASGHALHRAMAGQHLRVWPLYPKSDTQEASPGQRRAQRMPAGTFRGPACEPAPGPGGLQPGRCRWPARSCPPAQHACMLVMGLGFRVYGLVYLGNQATKCGREPGLECLW